MSVLANVWIQAAFIVAALVILALAQRGRFRRKRLRYALTCVVAIADLALCGSTMAYSLHAIRAGADRPALIVAYDPHDPAAGLYVNGIIGTDFASRVERHLWREPTRTLYLTSPGGYLNQAAKVAKVIHDQRLRVVVTDYCDSACVALFAAAPRRGMFPGATIGLHHPSFTGPFAILDHTPLARYGTAKYKAMLRRGGFDARCLRFVDDVPSTSVKNLGAKTLRALCHVAVASLPAPPAPPGAA